MKEAGWESLLTEVGLFCQKYNVDVVDMNQKYVDSRKKLRMIEELTNDHHYHVDKFIAILYRQIRELDDHFGEIGTELLLSMSLLDPKNSFEAFDQEKLRGRLVQRFQVSGMGLVHSKPILDVWLENLFVQTHTSNPQGMSF